MSSFQHNELENSRYLISVDDAAFEVKRLQDLHSWLFGTLYESRYIYDRSITVEPNDRVLDVGTGPGNWLLGLSKEVPDGAKLIGVDISDKTIPEVHPPNVSFRIASVLDLPAEWDESFDFIHESLLTAALSMSEWFTAAQEMFRVLKPGKNIQLIECSVTDIVGDSDAPGLRWFLDIFKRMCERRGTLVDCSRHLGEVLRRAGFVDIIERREAMPLDETVGELRIPGKLGILNGIRNLKRTAVELGLVGTSAEWDGQVKRLGEEWDNQKRLSMACYMVCAKKPE